jgi:hypothetical protein
MALTLLAEQYEALTRVTQALVDAVERDDTEALDALVSERATLLAAAEQHLTAATGAGSAPRAAADGDQARAEAAARLAAAARLLEESDARLRTVMAARAGELPVQLAELRGARSGLSGYQASVLDPSTSVDRSG